MINTEKKESRYFFPVAAALIAFTIGYIHHRWFFPLYFHGDAAAMQVLAKAIVDEKSLLPLDFSYGNQLIFLRSSPFIALALFFGAADYKAFILGSAASIAFWAVILYCLLLTYFDSAKKGLLFTTLLLIPLGFWDSDYVLGQQSHLSNAILSLGIVIFSYRYTLDQSKFSLILGCICLFIISSEAPMRGVLVLAPVLAAIALTSRRTIWRVMVSYSGSAFILAYIANKLLIRFHPIGKNYFNMLTFQSGNEFFQNLVSTTGETAANISSLNLVAGGHFRALNLIAYASGIFFVTAFFVFIFTGASVAVKLGFKKIILPEHQHSVSEKTLFGFVPLTAALGVIFGAIAIAGLNPDSSRHYLWAYFLFKLCLLTSLYDVASRLITKKAVATCVVAVSLLQSFWLAKLAVLGGNIDKQINARNYTEEINSIKRIAEETGIQYLYGEDYWRMMPLNTLLHNVNAQILAFSEGELHLTSSLTRPSWACARGKVLYYLKTGQIDRKIEEKLLRVGGTKVHDGNGYTIWTGPPVWRLPFIAGCYMSALNFDGESFLSLPSKVAINENGIKKTSGNPGFLVYGPYSAMKAGSYRLNIYGSSETVSGPYADVVSNNGSLVHARWDLKRDAKGVLLRDVVIQLPADVSDIEVRVWVNAGDELKLSGYSLTPYPAGAVALTSNRIR